MTSVESVATKLVPASQFNRQRMLRVLFWITIPQTWPLFISVVRVIANQHKDKPSKIQKPCLVRQYVFSQTKRYLLVLYFLINTIEVLGLNLAVPSAIRAKLKHSSGAHSSKTTVTVLENASSNPTYSQLEREKATQLLTPTLLCHQTWLVGKSPNWMDVLMGK